MLKVLSLFIIISITLTYSISCTKSNTWISLPNLPLTTGEVGSVILLNDKLYVAGEQNENTFVFDFNTNLWSNVTMRIFPGNHQSSQLINSKWYLIGGIDEHSYGKLQIYDATTNKWMEKSSLPSTYDGGSIQTVYYNKTNCIYACGGIIGFNNGQNKGGTQTTNQCARYNVEQDKWYFDIPNLPKGVNHAATGLDNNGNMWIIGGRGGNNVPSDGYNIIQVYNINKNEWITSNDEDSNIANMPVGRGGTGNAVYYNNKFYVFGGETKTNPGGYATNNLVYNRTDIYDINLNKWSIGQIMPNPRHGIYPVLRNNIIYIAGGGLHNGYNHSNIFDAYCI